MTAPSRQEVERIARDLSKAQKFWVINQRAPTGGGMWPVRNALHAKGLAEPFSGRPTALSIAVRDYLREVQP